MSHVPGITNKDLRKVVDDAISRGWTVEWTGKVHVRLRHPSGQVVICSGTPKSGRAAKNTAAALRRIERQAQETQP